MKQHRTIAAAVVAATLVVPAAASAHAKIKTLSPKPGATKSTSLRSVTATFEEAIVSGSLTVRKGGTKVSVGEAKLVDHKAGLRARLHSRLAKGTYKASMKWLADDGHVERKTWTFTLR